MAYPLAHSPGLRYLRSMYIRRTHTNNSATGERYFTYRLVKSERVGGCTRQSTLLNLGRHFAIEQDYWPTLCARVDEIMGCQLTLLPIECPLAVEREAQRHAMLVYAIGTRGGDEDAALRQARLDLHRLAEDARLHGGQQDRRMGSNGSFAMGVGTSGTCLPCP